MYRRTIEALEHFTDYVEFERLCSDILARQGYEGIDPQGVEGKDGGKDALIYAEDGDIVCHFSTAKEWRSKLRSDLQKANENDLSGEKFIFVTNRKVGGTEKDSVKEEAKDEYGWVLDLYDAERLRVLLDNYHQDLREDYLEIPPEPGLTTDLGERAENHHAERVRKIQQGEAPVDFDSDSALIIHIVPKDAFSNPYQIEVGELSYRNDKMKPLGRNVGGGFSLNSKGAVYTDTNRRTDSLDGYVQVFRTGIIESVSTGIFDTLDIDDGDPYIPSQDFEFFLTLRIKEYLRFLQAQGIALPAFICLTLTGVSGFNLLLNNPMELVNDNYFDEDTIHPPKTKVVSYEEDIRELLSNQIDVIWNAAGRAQSPYYDEEDGWDSELADHIDEWMNSSR